MNLAKYFNVESYQNNITGKFLSAEGNEWDFNEDQYLAEGQGQKMGVSKPIKLKVVNTTTVAKSNVVLFNANAAIGGATAGTVSGVTITVINSADGLYATLLGEIFNKPFRVGKTEIVSTTAAQLNESVTVEYISASGKDYREVLDISVSEFQYTQTKVTNKENWDINGSTKVTISSLLASETIYMNFYPMEVRDSGSFTKPINQAFAAPKTAVPIFKQ